MSTVAGMADIFTADLKMRLGEIMILEACLLDAVDLALNAGQREMALEARDALLDLHALKQERLQRADVLALWEWLFRDEELNRARPLWRRDLLFFFVYVKRKGRKFPLLD